MKILARLLGHKPPKSCEWGDSCVCRGVKPNCCELCKWYWMIDSGYGYCKALPQHTVVAWCRDTCSLFVGKGD